MSFFLSGMRLAGTRLVSIACLILLFDFATKWAVHQYMPLIPGRGTPSISLFRGFLGGIDGDITHAVNHGAAWGVFSSYPTALLVFRLFFIAALLVYLAVYAEKALLVPLVLIASGAIGNVIDYFLYGHVIDMIHIRLYGWDYPVFNIADSCICIGTFWIFVHMLFHPNEVL